MKFDILIFMKKKWQKPNVIRCSNYIPSNKLYINQWFIWILSILKERVVFYKIYY